MKNYKLFIVTVFLISIASFGQNGPLREHFKEKKRKNKSIKSSFHNYGVKFNSR